MWESLANIEIKWAGETKWECLDAQSCADDSGGRLLGADDLLELENTPSGLWIADEVKDVDAQQEPPRRMYAKGGVLMGHHAGRGHYGGGSRCHGQCTVPRGSTESCCRYCKNQACYSHYDEAT